QTRQEADAGIREHAGVRLKGWAAGGAPLLRSRATVPAGGESWGRWVAGDSSDLQFALQHDDRRIAAGGCQSGNGARLHGFGRQRGFNRRFETGTRIIFSRAKIRRTLETAARLIFSNGATKI